MIPRLRRKYRRVSLNELRLIAMLRWGTEEPNLDTPVKMTTIDIAKVLHMPQSTIGYIVASFHIRGLDGYRRNYARWRMLSSELQ